MSRTVLKKPEILSPAGSLEAFFAAMESGADAVYAGLKEFSARAKAKNFTLADMEKMLGYAHGLGRKIYVTINTLVKEKELPLLAETLSSLEAMEADGVILQDMAVWRLARKNFPNLKLHASTQMTVHNTAGVKLLERMGFERAVLARELTLQEIAAIRSRTSLELEHFIHGALCFSFSGQCYFSSFLGGKSGNRGRCTQPCRRRYRYRNQEGYYFSPNDLCAIDLLPELAQAGVISFKIEGRMKSAEYVANVVSAYRRVLDAEDSQRKAAIKEAKELLKQSFGRVPTKGFLLGDKPTDIAIPSLKGSTGRFLGEITAVRGGRISFKTRDRLHLGDRIRIQPRSDRAGTAFTIKELWQGKRSVKKVAAGAFVTVPSTFQNVFQVGDTVFKVSSEQAFTMSEAACRKKLAVARPSTEPLQLTVTLDKDLLTLRGETPAVCLERDYPVTTVAAEDHPLSTEVLQGVFAKTAGEPLHLSGLRAEHLPPVVIAPSRLKEIRRDFYRLLRQEGQKQRQKQQEEHRRNALASLLPPQTAAVAQPEVTVAVADIRDAHLLNDPVVQRVLVPLRPGNVQGLGRLGKKAERWKKRIVWDLPFVLFDSQWEDCRRAVHDLYRHGYRLFRLNNLGHFPLFDGLEDVQLLTGYRLFSLNTQAIAVWKELGAQETSLYIEDDRNNLADLLQRPIGIPAALTVYGAVPLITSRIRIKDVRAGSPVISDRGDRYRVNWRDGLTTLTSETDFSLLEKIGELQKLGGSRFILDLSHIGPFSSRGKAVLEAFKKGDGVPGTSTFNYDTGME